MSNIKEVGLIHPMGVMLNKKTNKFVLIDGYRRYCAIKKLGIIEIECCIFENF